MRNSGATISSSNITNEAKKYKYSTPINQWHPSDIIGESLKLLSRSYKVASNKNNEEMSSMYPQNSGTKKTSSIDNNNTYKIKKN